MGHALDLDQVGHLLVHRQHPVTLAGDCQPALEVSQLLALDVDPVAVDLETEALRSQAVDARPVALAVDLELRGACGRVRDLGTAAGRRGHEARLLDLSLHFVDADRRFDQRDLGVPVRQVPAGHHLAVEPADVDRPGPDLVAVQQVEQESLVGGAAVDHHGGVRQRPPQPRQSLLTVRAPGDDLGDHRVEFRRHAVAGLDAGVDAQARSGGQAHQVDPARRRREGVLRVLGVEPHLDRRAPRGRRFAFETAAAGDVQLQFDQVDAGGHLGHRMLDLQPGVDLHEGERLAALVVEELDGAGVVISHGLGQAHRRRPQLAILLGGERW